MTKFRVALCLILLAFLNNAFATEKKIIIVGSTSEIKIQAVKEAFSRLNIDAEVIGVKATSNVPEQPFDDETTQGAENRIKNARKLNQNGDFYVAIENGIFKEGSTYFDRAIVVIETKDGKKYTLKSKDGAPIDKKYIEEANNIGFDKTTVAKIMQSHDTIKKHDDPHIDLIGKNKRDILEETVYLIFKENRLDILPSFSKRSVVIVGSYRKFYKQVLEKIEEFEKEGYNVLMPPKSNVINPGEEFVKLKGDENVPIKLIELNFLEAVKNTDIIYVVNPNGYIGLSGSFEMGFAYSIGKPIYCMEKPVDPTMAMFCKS